MSKPTVAKDWKHFTRLDVPMRHCDDSWYDEAERVWEADVSSAYYDGLGNVDGGERPAPTARELLFWVDKSIWHEFFELYLNDENAVVPQWPWADGSCPKPDYNGEGPSPVYLKWVEKHKAKLAARANKPQGLEASRFYDPEEAKKAAAREASQVAAQQLVEGIGQLSVGQIGSAGPSLQAMQVGSVGTGGNAASVVAASAEGDDRWLADLAEHDLQSINDATRPRMLLNWSHMTQATGLSEEELRMFPGMFEIVLPPALDVESCIGADVLGRLPPVTTQWCNTVVQPESQGAYKTIKLVLKPNWIRSSEAAGSVMCRHFQGLAYWVIQGLNFEEVPLDVWCSSDGYKKAYAAEGEALKELFATLFKTMIG